MLATPTLVRIWAWAALLALMPLVSAAQHTAGEGLPVVAGRSTARTGMLYYDHAAANESVARKYRYTLCPDSAACMRVDFNLIDLQQSHADSGAVDFILVYDGEGADAPLLATLGPKSGNLTLQGRQGCMTVEFVRDIHGMNSTWTLHWRGLDKAACIDPMEPGPCAEVQDVCAPRYVETLPAATTRGPAKPAYVPANPAFSKPAARWYRFMAQRDGLLTFDIAPADPSQDYDWILLRGDSAQPANCPSALDSTRLLAYNFAAGSAQRGCTGMGELGESRFATESGCPYARPLPVRRGEVFFLLVESTDASGLGFELRLGDVVWACTHPRRDFLAIDPKPVVAKPEVDPRRTFLAQTKVLRLELNEKANRPFSAARLPNDLFARSAGQAKALGPVADLRRHAGIAHLLVQGLKYGAIEAVAAHDFRTPVQYGDLVELAMRVRDSSAVSGTWWNPGRDLLAGYGNAIELIVEESFDKQSGLGRREVRYLRLLWTDHAGKMPDYNVAVFPFSQIRPLLDAVEVENPQNEAASMSLLDLIEGRAYQATCVETSTNNVNNPDPSKKAVTSVAELQDYLWNR